MAPPAKKAPIYAQVQAGFGRSTVWLVSCSLCGSFVHDQPLHNENCPGL